MPWPAAGQCPGSEDMSVGFDRGTARGQILELAHRSEPTAPFAGATRVFAQFVAADAQRQVALDVLDWVVARIGVERVDRIHPVEPASAAVAALEDLHVHPVRAAADPGKGDHLQIADPGRYLAGKR